MLQPLHSLITLKGSVTLPFLREWIQLIEELSAVIFEVSGEKPCLLQLVKDHVR